MQSVTIDGLTVSAKYPGTIAYPQKIEIEAGGTRYRYVDPPSGWIWITPVMTEVCVGMEVTGYSSAEN